MVMTLPQKLVDYLAREHDLAYAEITPDLKIAHASKKIDELTSDPQKEVEGFPLHDLFWEFVGAEGALLDILNGVSPEYQLDKVNRQRADGVVQYLNFRVFPMNDLQPGDGLLLIIEDMTKMVSFEQQLVQDRNELRLLQAQLSRANAELIRLNQLKSTFLSIAAHDLRAPLSAIRGYADLVLAELPDEAPQVHRDFLAIIGLEVERLDRLITDFLDLDEIEKGALDIQVSPCDLNTIVREVARMMQGLALWKSLQLDVNLSEQAVTVLADAERVRQILYNLLNNAIKYTPEGGHILVTTRLVQDFGSVQVKDTGPGIPKADLEHLFELYYRTDKARKSQVRGTGLGLFIAKYLVEAQAGNIRVSSQPGVGTEFNVRFPLIP